MRLASVNCLFTGLNGTIHKLEESSTKLFSFPQVETSHLFSLPDAGVSDFMSHRNMYSFKTESEHVVRDKRAPTPARTCSLYIQTDSLLFEHVNEKLQNTKKARDEITALIAEHVKAVNHIYKNTNFNGFIGFNFVVQRITVSVWFLFTL